MYVCVCLRWTITIWLGHVNVCVCLGFSEQRTVSKFGVWPVFPAFTVIAHREPHCTTDKYSTWNYCTLRWSFYRKLHMHVGNTHGFQGELMHTHIAFTVNYCKQTQLSTNYKTLAWSTPHSTSVIRHSSCIQLNSFFPWVKKKDCVYLFSLAYWKVQNPSIKTLHLDNLYGNNETSHQGGLAQKHSGI